MCCFPPHPHQRAGISEAFEGSIDRDPSFYSEFLLDVVWEGHEGTAAGAGLDLRGEGVFLHSGHYRLEPRGQLLRALTGQLDGQFGT